ncbi:MAG TPA: hypothetical protein VGC42_31270 [Kofleriaceae bacterium]
MGLVEELYGPAATEPLPPEAQRWAFYLDHGVRPVCTFVRRQAPSGWASPRLVISYPGAEPALPPDPVVPWEPVLEDWLLAHRVPATSPANEAERLGFDLSARLGVIEREHTSPVYTAVLLRFLYDHDCPLYLPLEKKLGATRAYEPDAADASHAACEAIKAVIQDVWQQLETLGYAAEDSKQIRGRALAYYLHDRFDIDEQARPEQPAPQAS